MEKKTDLNTLELNELELFHEASRKLIEEIKNNPNIPKLPEDFTLQKDCRNSLAENIKTQEDADLFRYMLAYSDYKKKLA